MYPLPSNLTELRDQPVEFIEEVCGLYFRTIVLEEGVIVPQHTHPYDHATFIGAGKARLWVDGKWAGDYEAGRAVHVKADRQHIFQGLASTTRLSCIHDMKSAAFIKEMGS